MAERKHSLDSLDNPTGKENASLENPADDQVEAEVFDEEKHLNRADQQRPAEDSAASTRTPVDEAMPGAKAERFGERLPEGRERADALDEVTAEQERMEEALQKEGASKNKSDETLSKDEKVDEAMKETFPASDSPSFTPGKPE